MDSGMNHGGRARRPGFAVGSALVALYVLVRCLHLDLFVTTDEPFWLGRSANFYRAVMQGDLGHTYQMAHPGVLTMWAGAVAYAWSFPEYVQSVTGNLDRVYGIGAVLSELGKAPLDILIAARVVKIILQGVFFVISMGLLHLLFGRPVMVIAGLLIAFDPFVSGMDSLLHVDGLFAISAFAAILALAAAVRSRPDAIAPWMFAGALAACAWMTRATGIVLIVFVGVVALIQIVSQLRVRRDACLRSALEPPAFGVVLWLTGAAAMSLLLLPALWVDPFGTMQRVWDWSSNAATAGHERPVFFLDVIHNGDPGVWFYPVTLLWRLTPVSLAGIVLLVAVIPAALRHRWLRKEEVASLALLVGFAATYTGAMTIGAKKFDRYILPVYPIVSVLAAVGVVLAARWVCHRVPDQTRFALPAVATLLIAGQALSLAGALPYRLDYANPLLGGLDGAQHAIQLGWGEGAGQAVDFIVADADGRDVTVQKVSATEVFSWFAPPNVHFEDVGLDTPAGWYETDYFVAGIQEWQRDLSPPYTMMRDHVDPAHTVSIGDVPFFSVYTPRTLPLPDELIAASGCAAGFGDTLRLVQIVGRDGTIDLYWLTTGEPPGQLEVRVEIASSEAPGEELSAVSTAWTPAADGHLSTSTVIDPRIETSAPLADYRMTIHVRDASLQAFLPASAGPSTSGSDGIVTHSECFYDG